jgi:hypothetical protein
MADVNALISYINTMIAERYVEVMKLHDGILIHRANFMVTARRLVNDGTIVREIRLESDSVSLSVMVSAGVFAEFIDSHSES